MLEAAHRACEETATLASHKTVNVMCHILKLLSLQPMHMN
jgi:hypothetical protein